MYWFSHPPYFRYAAALVLVIGALWVELRHTEFVAHPFADAPIAAGSPLDPSLFVTRPVPPGLLETVTVAGTARHAIAAGEPLTEGAIDPDGVSIPPGWWTVEVSLPTETEPGDEVRLVLGPVDVDGEPTLIDGIAVRTPAPTSDPFGFEARLGLVAIPDGQAAEVASAVGDRRITVLVRRSG